MFFADYHLHTNFSSDSKSPMETMVEKAVSIGLKEIAFTDHIDFAYPDPAFPFIFDYNKYSDYINLLREKYKNKIQIFVGVELGLQPHIQNEIDAFVNSNHFDFIIGSTHCVDKTEVILDDFFSLRGRKGTYMRYFEDVLSSAKQYSCFNVYGHIDYINRYGNFTDKTLLYSDFHEIIDSILKTLIENGKGLDLNTSGFRYGLNSTCPQLDVLRRFKELGGEIVTIGSDAHVPNDIAAYFNIAYDMLSACGFKYLTVFRDKKPSFIPLDSII